MSQFARLFVCCIFHPWRVLCVQEILGDTGAKQLLFVPFCSSPTSEKERKSGAWKAAVPASFSQQHAVARGLRLVSSDRFFIKPTPSSEV